MSGLREALEKLVQGWQYVGEPVDMTQTDSVMDDCADELKRVLTAHPAEPAPVANRERVAEVLQRTIHLLDSNPKQWNELDPIEHVAYRDEAESLAVALFTSSGVFRDEATVKAELAELIAVRSQELIGGTPGVIAAAVAREAVTS